MTLFEMKEKLFALQNERKTIADWIAEKAADPNTSMEEINAKKAKMEELTSRIEILQKSHDDMEAEQRTAMAMQKGSGAGMTEKDVRMKAKADAYRALAIGTKADVEKAYSHLGAIPALDADLGNGSKLLPTNLQDEIIVEPVEENPMRGIMRVSNIRGLEEPKLIFDLDGGYDDITDKQDIEAFIRENNDVSMAEIELRDLKQVLDNVVVEDEAEFKMSQVQDGIFQKWQVSIERFHSDRVKRKIDEYNINGQTQASAKGKEFKPILISEEGLETIEWLSVDSTKADKNAPWHSDAEIKIDRLGYAIENGKKTTSFWDGTIRTDNPPLRLKIRNICGDESVFVI